MIEVTAETFERDVLGSDRPVLLDFWAEWCPPCKMISPILEEIEREYGDKVVIAKINADEHPSIALRYDVIGLPTLNLYRDGEVVHQIKGARPKRAIVDGIAPHI
ncbi:thioredoxin [Herbidospora sp. NBRC 101105]|uniref:thioredoxin n=1 Tax=Herbidospora sp. NBRC 101105 TaxID=3032195 RepID=UPI0024A37D16|nr:thioredoxin [Herbidospora sp. NBRC 101105]GLX92381.1 thioredoxin-1 [Herbidospora sp. NBRC 101105]